MRNFALIGLVVLGGVTAASADPSPSPSPSPLASPLAWSWFLTPTKAPPQSIGGYSAGCIAGAVALPVTGDGFRVARPERKRLFGHPALIGVLRDLGRQVKALRWTPLSIGDLGQPRGGPAPSGHASHQTGLDVDIWFMPPVGGHSPSMIDGAHQRPSPRFDARAVKLLALTAHDPRVERIFVHPILKRALCRAPADADRSWLHKLRPWWGHDDHFHVRLHCPTDSPACVAQAPLPAGDGCGELGWWFNPSAQAARDQGHQAYSSKVGATPSLPKPCDELRMPPR